MVREGRVHSFATRHTRNRFTVDSSEQDRDRQKFGNFHLVDVKAVTIDSCKRKQDKRASRNFASDKKISSRNERGA